MSDSQRHSTLEIYRRMLTEARPYWPHVALVLLMNLLATPLKLLLPLPLAIAADNVLDKKPLSPTWSSIMRLIGLDSPSHILFFACALLVGFTFLAYLNGLGIWMLTTFTREKLLLRFRSKLLTHLQELPLTYHDTKGVTDSTYRIQYDAQAVEWIVLDGVQPFVTSAVTILAMLYVTALIDWQLALVAVLLVPILFLLVRVWGKWLRTQWLSAKNFQSSAMSVVQESLGSLRLVKAFGTEDREHARFAQQAVAGMKGQMQVAFSQGTFDLATGVTLGIGTATALYIGVRHVQSDVLTLGEFLLVWAYMAQLFGPLQMMGNKLSTLQGALASADRSLAVLDEVPKVVEKPDARALDRATGHFIFENVGFGYDEAQLFLKKVNLDIQPGQCVGMVGATGAGKTTIAALLMRFYDPASGWILLDGIDLRDYRLDDLRQQFSVVLQDPVLFSTTIAENIAYGRPSASMDEIEAAAVAANAHLFIEETENGYLSQVGDRGMKLSGGERQRIALARAFLRDAPLLILDEPTSAVDLHTESLICDALERLIQSRTTFLITHRPSLLRLCDSVWNVDNGSVSETEHTLAQSTAPRAGSLPSIRQSG
jgi:ATP-binding cassette subfamily B protein